MKPLDFVAPFALCIVVLSIAVAPAQEQSKRVAPAFEVASIRPNNHGDIIHSTGLLPGGRFIATNISVLELIRLAYGVEVSQIAGAPNWIRSARFDIVAKAEGNEPPSLLMIRQLLSERFNLAAHVETRRLSHYALVTARRDRRLGPRLRASEVDCVSVMAAAPAPGASPRFPQPRRREMCDLFVGFAPRFEAGGVSMAQLATSLSRHVGRVVVNRTGLAGLFDFELEWTPQMPQPPAGPFRLNGVRVDPNGPSIFTALQEQLGLKLESSKGPVPVVVIDHVERPTED